MYYVSSPHPPVPTSIIVKNAYKKVKAAFHKGEHREGDHVGDAVFPSKSQTSHAL